MKKDFINLSIIIPVYNEENTLLDVLKNLKKLKNFCNLEIIVVNDGSTDKTSKIIEDNKGLFTKSINLNKNLGKGKAVIEGLKKCNLDYVLVQDADLEYDPLDIKEFIFQIENFKFDIILGSRFISNNRTVLNFWHMAGNKFISLLFNIINNTTFSDIYCCYFMFKRNDVEVNNLKSFGWGQQAEILTFVTNKNSKIFEIGVRYHGRSYAEGKKIKYYDVFSVIYWIIITKIRKFFI